MPSDYDRYGDPCELRISVRNPGPEEYTARPLFVILDVFGTCFFAPSYTNFDNYTVDVILGKQEIQVIECFIWPPGVGSAGKIRWISAMTDQEVTTLFGEMDIWIFGYGE